MAAAGRCSTRSMRPFNVSLRMFLTIPPSSIWQLITTTWFGDGLTFEPALSASECPGGCRELSAHVAELGHQPVHLQAHQVAGHHVQARNFASIRCRREIYKFKCGLSLRLG